MKIFQKLQNWKSENNEQFLCW